MNKEDLQSYGKVEVCEERDGMFHVKITDGFDGNAMNTFNLMKHIAAVTNDEYPLVHRCVTDKDMFDYVIKKK